jgi:hypothetical protein
VGAFKIIDRQTKGVVNRLAPLEIQLHAQRDDFRIRGDRLRHGASRLLLILLLQGLIVVDIAVEAHVVMADVSARSPSTGWQFGTLISPTEAQRVCATTV